jgi:hypothetical protein
VLASGTSSLPEAGGDYALYCDPYSPAEWALKIVELCRDDELITQLEQRIQTEYIPYTWNQSAQQVFDVVHPATEQSSELNIVYEPGYDLSTLSGKHVGGWIMGDARQPGIILFGPHIKLPVSNVEVSIDLVFSSDFRADITIRLAASQEILVSKMIKHEDIDFAKQIIKKNEEVNHRTIKLLPVLIDKPVSDVEVVMELLPGQGQVQIKLVTFSISNIHLHEKNQFSIKRVKTQKSLADVNASIRSLKLDEASLILQEIREQLTQKLYNMKYDEIARKRMVVDFKS